MNTQSGIRRTVAAAFLAGSFAFGTAWAVMDTAQPLELTGSADSVTGSVTTTVAAGSPVIVSFWANPTDAVTVDVDTFGILDANGMPVDTIASFHSPAPEYTVILVQDDSFVFPFDEGSTSPADPLLQNMVPTTSGLHYAVVTVAPERVADGGTFIGGGAGSFSVTLNITCVRASADAAAAPACAEGSTSTGGTETPPAESPPAPTAEEDSEPTTPPATEVKYVNIDIRPGSRALVRLNPKWKAVIPVAILSGPGFNVRDIDTSKLTFGRTGDEDTLRNCNKYRTRVNRDRRRDLVCYFSNSKAGFEVGDEQGILKGELKDGTPIEARGMLKVLPEKRRWGHRHGKGHEKHADHDRRHRGHRH